MTNRWLARCLCAGLVWAVGCDGAGTPAPADAAAGPEVADAADDGQGDGQPGPDVPDVRTDGGDVPFVCPHGPSAEGRGCALPCEDGWHDGADGRCHIDCPSWTAAAADGACTVTRCPQGWHLDEGTDPGCALDCPEGFEESADYASGCRLPCPEGFARSAEGGCERSCAAGMVADPAAATGCRLASVGPTLACPDGLWRSDPDGANPLYVHAAAAPGPEDGTPDHPYRTLAAAAARVQAEGWSDVTIFVADGEYAEALLFEDMESVRILGACAERVRIEAQGLGTRDEVRLGAVSAFAVQELHLSGVTIGSDLRGVLVANDTGGRAVSVTDVVVDRPEWQGIAVLGPIADVEIARCRIVEPVFFGVAVSACSEDYVPVPSTVRVDAVEVAGMRRCEGFDYCASIGVGVTCASDASVTGSLVHDFDQAVGGVFLSLGETATVAGNVVHGLAGQALVTVDGERVTVADNRLADCTPPGAIAGEDIDSCIAVHVEGYGRRAIVASVVGNFVAGAQPMGIWADRSGPGDAMDLTVARNELRDLDLAVWHTAGGALTLRDNRFRTVRVALSSTPADTLTAVGNELRDGATENRLPPGPTRDSLDSQFCQVFAGASGPDGAAELRGNHLIGLPALQAADPWGAVCFVGVPTVRVDGNVFEENRTGAGVLITDGSVADLSANRFLGIDDGGADPPGLRQFAILGGEAVGVPTRVTVEGNDIRDFLGGPGGSYAASFLFQRSDVEVNLLGNRLWRVGTLLLGSGSAETLERISVAHNDMNGTSLFLYPTRELTFEDNRCRGCYLALLGFATDGTTSIAGNWFDGGTLDAHRPAGTLSVQGNEFSSASGVALLLRSPTGTALVDHNLFDGVTALTWPKGAVGTVGDAVEVTGTPNEPGSGVRLTRNRFHGAARWGLIVSGAAGFVEGNLFDAGEDCSGGCGFAIQSEPQAGAVFGADVTLAERPEPPVGVVTVDEIAPR